MRPKEAKEIIGGEIVGNGDYKQKRGSGRGIRRVRGRGVASKSPEEVDYAPTIGEFGTRVRV